MLLVTIHSSTIVCVCTSLRGHFRGRFQRRRALYGLLPPELRKCKAKAKAAAVVV